MAAFTRSRLGYLLTNFSCSFINHASNFNRTRQALFHCSSLFYGKGQEINMPSLSPTMEEGKIVKWLKKEGDAVSPGDVLCDIETDKAVVSLEVEEEGILAKILVPENTPNIKVGSLIALMVAEGEDWKNVDVPSNAGVPTSSSSPSSSSSSSSSSTTDTKDSIRQEPVISGPPTTPITMPSLSPTMASGTIVKWLKKEGDTIAPGDVLCDIQTDKAVMALEAEEEGILAKIVAPDDSKDIEVGTLIALIVAEGEDWKSVVVPSQPLTEKTEVSQPQPSTGVASASGAVGGKKFGPAVKTLLSNYQLDPAPIKPTGRGNRLLKEDVLQYITDNKLEKKPPKTVSAPSALSKSIPKKPESVQTKKAKDTSSTTPKFIDIELTGMRQTIAKRLVQSKREIPHLYSLAKCDVDGLVKIKEGLSAEGIKVSLNDLLTKAVALTLQMYPKANALCINNEVRLANSVDICVAVATDKGLYTPVIKSANEKSVMNISEEIRALAAKARNGKLKPEEFQGGTFTISNLGMFGITHFKAIINPPQCGILAVGGTTESLDSDMKIRRHMILNLSCDRRVLQDQEAAEFMGILKYFIENPKLITVDMNQSISMRL